MRRAIGITLLLTVASLSARIGGIEQNEANRRASFALMPAIIEFAKTAEKVEIFEGPARGFAALFRDDDSPEEQEAERRRAATPKIEIGGYEFYKPAQPIRPAHRRWLNEILSKRGSFQPFTAYKMCGGFHPDYCVRFTTGENVLTLQFCFGCCEMAAKAGKKWAHVDLGKSAKAEFQKILGAYAKHR